MSRRTDDLDPAPRRLSAEATVLHWPVTRRLRCPTVVPPPPESYVSVVESRRTTRVMEPAPLREIINLIAFATRPRSIKVDDSFGRSRGLALSAGALHPVSIVIIDRRTTLRAMRYVPADHVLELLQPNEHRLIKELAEKCAEILPEARGTILSFLADLFTVEAVYDRAASLLWRDAGAVLQSLALAATAFRLAFCPVGILGNEVVRALALPPARVIATGAAVVGRSTTTRSGTSKRRHPAHVVPH